MTQVHTDIDRIGRRFYGRERPLRKIVSGLLRTPPISYSLVGACAIGKSALLSQLAADDGPLSAPTFAQWRPQSFQQGDNVEVVQIDCHWALAESCLLDALYCALCEQLKPQVGSQKWWAQLEEEEPSALVRLTHIVRQIRREQRRLIVLIDNVEQLFKQSSSSTNGLAALWPLLHELAIVTTSPQPLHDLAPASDTTSFFSELTQLFVGTLEPAAAAAWLADLATQTPGLDSLQAILLELTGAHPFLLHCVAPVLAEVEHYLAPGEMISEGHGALIRLRLAEHARPLFARQWLQLQTPPEPLEAAVIFELLTRLTQPSDPAHSWVQSTEVETQSWNWLINQAVVLHTGADVQLYSPLFTDYVKTRMHACLAQSPRSTQPVADLPIFDQLTKTEIRLLNYFLAHANAIVSPEQLLADVWKRPDASSRRVQEAIRRLRMQLKQAQPAVGSIESERGRGYRFIPTTP